MQASDPFWEDFTWAEFIGGPLDCQIKKMEVFVGHIPMLRHRSGRIKSYYMNVNEVECDENMRPLSRVRYKYFVDGKETL